MQRAACILFHVRAPGRLPTLEDRRRAADRAYTGKAYAREPDTIQRHLERDLLDPLIVEALRGLKGLPAAPQPVGVGNRVESLEDELERTIPHAGTGAASEGRLDRMNRRALLRNLSAVGTLAVLRPPTDHLDMPEWMTAQHGPPFDGSALDDLATINARLWQIFAASDWKGDVFALVRHQLDALMEGLQDSRKEAVHIRLCELLSELLQLAGEIFFDLEQYVEAANFYTVAASVSKEANARDLWSCAVIRHAFIGVYEGRFADAIPMLELSAHIAGSGDSQLSTRRWVDAVAAQAFAGMKNAAGCENAIAG